MNQAVVKVENEQLPTHIPSSGQSRQVGTDLTPVKAETGGVALPAASSHRASQSSRHIKLQEVLPLLLPRLDSASRTRLRLVCKQFQQSHDAAQSQLTLTYHTLVSLAGGHAAAAAVQRLLSRGLPPPTTLKIQQEGGGDPLDAAAIAALLRGAGSAAMSLTLRGRLALAGAGAAAELADAAPRLAHLRLEGLDRLPAAVFSSTLLGRLGPRLRSLSVAVTVAPSLDSDRQLPEPVSGADMLAALCGCCCPVLTALRLRLPGACVDPDSLGRLTKLRTLHLDCELSGGTSGVSGTATSSTNFSLSYSNAASQALLGLRSSTDMSGQNYRSSSSSSTDIAPGVPSAHPAGSSSDLVSMTGLHLSLGPPSQLLVLPPPPLLPPFSLLPPLPLTFPLLPPDLPQELQQAQPPPPPLPPQLPLPLSLPPPLTNGSAAWPGPQPQPQLQPLLQGGAHGSDATLPGPGWGLAGTLARLACLQELRLPTARLDVACLDALRNHCRLVLLEVYGLSLHPDAAATALAAADEASATAAADGDGAGAGLAVAVGRMVLPPALRTLVFVTTPVPVAWLAALAPAPAALQRVVIGDQLDPQHIHSAGICLEEEHADCGGSHTAAMTATTSVPAVTDADLEVAAAPPRVARTAAAHMRAAAQLLHGRLATSEKAQSTCKNLVVSAWRRPLQVAAPPPPGNALAVVAAAAGASQAPSPPPPLLWGPHAPWLRELPYLACGRRLHLADLRLEAEDLGALVAHVPWLQELQLSRCRWPAAALVQLAQLACLQELTLDAPHSDCMAPAAGATSSLMRLCLQAPALQRVVLLAPAPPPAALHPPARGPAAGARRLAGAAGAAVAEHGQVLHDVAASLEMLGRVRTATVREELVTGTAAGFGGGGGMVTCPGGWPRRVMRCSLSVRR